MRFQYNDVFDFLGVSFKTVFETSSLIFKLDDPIAAGVIIIFCEFSYSAGAALSVAGWRRLKKRRRVVKPEKKEVADKIGTRYFPRSLSACIRFPGYTKSDDLDAQNFFLRVIFRAAKWSVVVTRQIAKLYLLPYLMHRLFLSDIEKKVFSANAFINLE